MNNSIKGLISPDKITPRIITDKVNFEEVWDSQRDWTLSNISHIAYFMKDDVIAFMTQLGAKEIKFYSNDGAQAFLASWDDKAVLAFRGTQLMEHLPEKYPNLGFFQRLLIHLIIRFRFNISRLPFINNDVIADFTFCHARLTRTRGVKVHSGFLSETKKLWKHIIKDLRSFEGEKPLWVTGHSLGGAMAVITAMKYPVKEVYTFGSPRVGIRIKKALSKDRHTRYVNGDDIVTKLPPSWLYYLHHGKNIHLRSKDENLFLDHSIIDYSKNILRKD
ncbi:MAG: lipase family protein [Gammaproteobacteria bacterium]|nr:lipase family protein [Gammaproteobacteria bacterium]